MVEDYSAMAQKGKRAFTMTFDGSRSMRADALKQPAWTTCTPGGRFKTANRVLAASGLAVVLCLLLLLSYHTGRSSVTHSWNRPSDLASGSEGSLAITGSKGIDYGKDINYQPVDCKESNMVAENGARRKLYFHVGPGKMATTTFQKSLMSDKLELHQDGYCIYDSQETLKALRLLHASETIDAVNSTEMWRTFTTFLDHCDEVRQDVILSSEFMGLLENWKWDKLLKPLLARWDFHLVVGYRIWYMWYPSVYFQIFRFKAALGWPGDDLKTSVPALTGFHRDKRTTKLFTAEYIDHWKALVAPTKLSVLVYNMNEDANVLKTIFCRMLNATHTCAKHIESDAPSENTGFSLEYDRLALAAHEAGLLPEKIDRLTAAENIENHLESIGVSLESLPRTCVQGEERRFIYEQSLRFEEQFGTSARGAESEHIFKERFEQFAEARLCSTNVSAALELYGNEWAQIG